MNQELINNLFQKTEEQFNNIKTNENSQTNINDYKLNSRHTPQCLTANDFIFDDSQFFMSFHCAEGNENQHYHDFFEINYVIKGNPVGVINNQEVYLTKGNLSIMNPNAIHYFKKYDDKTDLILNIVLPKEYFNKSFLIPLLSDPVLNAFFIRYRVENKLNPSFIFLDHLDLETEQFIELLIKEYTEKNNYSQMIQDSLISLLFAFILRSYNKNTKKNPTVVGDILDYIYQNYSTCTIHKLSEVFNYHPKYLSALIHKTTGFSYRDLITKIKMENSIYFLLHTDLPIDVIATSIGYKEKSSFYNCFKKFYNNSPSSYRREKRISLMNSSSL